MAEVKAGYWEEFYAKASLALEPSSFAKHITNNGYVKAGDTVLDKYSEHYDIAGDAVLDKNTAGDTVLDIGCGNGRDALHFAAQGAIVTGIDASHAAIDILNQDQHPNATFRCVDVNEPAFQELHEFDHFYMRFFLHALTPPEEANVFDVLRRSKPGARVFAEFRTVNDPLMQKGEVLSETERKFGHYRRFLEVEAELGKLREVGFTRMLLKSEEGNLSIAGDDNPVLGRIIADKPTN